MRNETYRFDRLLSIYFFHPLLKLFPRPKTIRIPILMYHGICREEERNIHPYFRVNTSPEIFYKHMQFLHENNYKVIPLKEIHTYFNQQQNSQEKNIVITFDDGFRDFYTEAFPVLQKFNFTATVFLPAGLINNKEKFKNKECMSWDEIRELRSRGIDFGSHTVNHPQLALLPYEQIEYEIKESKIIIENSLGEQITLFSYPYAFPQENKQIVNFLEKTLLKAGYKTGVTTIIGTASPKDNILFLKRIPVNSCDDISLMKVKLEGGYDWLEYPQFVYKVMKNKAQNNKVILPKL